MGLEHTSTRKPPNDHINFGIAPIKRVPTAMLDEQEAPQVTIIRKAKVVPDRCIDLGLHVASIKSGIQAWTLADKTRSGDRYGGSAQTADNQADDECVQNSSDLKRQRVNQGSGGLEDGGSRTAIARVAT
ncbi:hypothetical protein VPH35_020623 [Triticum aestivum]